MTPAPTRFQMALTPTIVNALNDTAVTNLTNAAGPVGPGDIAWAFQWDVTLAPGQVLLVSKDKQIQIVPTSGSLGLAMVGAVLLVRRRRA